MPYPRELNDDPLDPPHCRPCTSSKGSAVFLLGSPLVCIETKVETPCLIEESCHPKWWEDSQCSTTSIESSDSDTTDPKTRSEQSSAFRKRRRVCDFERENSDFHSNEGAAAADFFYSQKVKRVLDSRANTHIYHMRAFNNWVKATQIQELNPTSGAHGFTGQRPLRVLDLACGKGKDLERYLAHPRGVCNYVGSDVARGSLRDAAIRARTMRDKIQRCTFTCADLGADLPGRLISPKLNVMQKLLTWTLQDELPHSTAPPAFTMVPGGGIAPHEKFDVVSIQFAIHYMMQTRQRARRFFKTVSELLDIGGNLICTTIDARVVISHLMNLGLNLHFDEDDETDSSCQPQAAEICVGGGACRIKFEPEVVKRIFTAETDGSDLSNDMFGLEYSFSLREGGDGTCGLRDVVNLPEWLTPIPVLVALAKEVGLDLEYVQNFHEFYTSRNDPNENAAAHNSLSDMNVLNWNGSISKDEWEISRLYVALKFTKIRESSTQFEN